MTNIVRLFFSPLCFIQNFSSKKNVHFSLIEEIFFVVLPTCTFFHFSEYCVYNTTQSSTTIQYTIGEGRRFSKKFLKGWASAMKFKTYAILIVKSMSMKKNGANIFQWFWLLRKTNTDQSNQKVLRPQTQFFDKFQHFQNFHVVF